MKIWTLVVANFNVETPCGIDTNIYNNDEDALSAFNEAHNEWKNHIRANYDDNEKDFEQWLLDAMHDDVFTDDYKFLHYIYNEGEEKVFILQGKEVL